MAEPLTLVLGTGNRKKLIELVELLAPTALELAPAGLKLEPLSAYPQAISVVEDGDSFAANARLKASQQAVHLNRWVLGEDSGLAVDALRGAPGIYSARYSGEGATDESNNRRLLAELADTPLERRTAYYVCYAALSDPAGTIRAEAEGRCHGRIRFAPSGAAGFGYDPLFEIAEYHQTFAELGLVVKAILSHRARAIESLLPQLERVFAEAN
jgi:XTP/dITP diphosphohydrolase